VIAYLLGDPPAVQGAVGGLRVWLRPADRTASEAFWSGCYEDNITDVLAAFLSPGATVVDAGANVGLIGLRLADRLRTLRAGRVLLVEPVPANVRLLEASIATNQLEAFCTVFDVGLADVSGVATLLVEGRKTRSGNAGPLAPNRYRGHLTETVVSLRTLDDLLREAREPRIDLIKLDVEGGELALLRGAIRSIEKDRPLIFGEFHPDLMPRLGATFIDVMALLAPLGYRAFAIAGRRHLVEVSADPRRGDVVLATSQTLRRLLAISGDDWLVTRSGERAPTF